MGQVMHLRRAELLEAARYPRCTLVRQALGSVRVALDALRLLRPEVGAPQPPPPPLPPPPPNWLRPGSARLRPACSFSCSRGHSQARTVALPGGGRWARAALQPLKTRLSPAHDTQMVHL